MGNPERGGEALELPEKASEKRTESVGFAMNLPINEQQEIKIWTD